MITLLLIPAYIYLSNTNKKSNQLKLKKIDKLQLNKPYR